LKHLYIDIQHKFQFYSNLKCYQFKEYLIKSVFVFLLVLLSFQESKAIPNPALVGYWHNWDYEPAPFLAPERVHSAYNIINIAFAVPREGSKCDMYFHPLIIKKDDFKSRIKQIQTSGKKVVLSLGGGNSPVTLDSAIDKNIFVQSILRLLVDYEFDGIDIDLENGSLRISGGTITEPIDTPIILLIEAVKEIMQEYHNHFGRKAFLSVAPETAYVQGGQSGWGGIWGSYLPFLDALRDSIDILQVQLYNSGSMYGLDRRVYSQSTTDFIVAMTEAVIVGFNTKGGFFKGFPESKVVIGLPACPLAAGSGFTEPDTVAAAVNYLLGKSSTPPGIYRLRREGGYPNLRGMMTWSINWDATDSCTVSYQFADNFTKLFPNHSSIVDNSKRTTEANKTNSPIKKTDIKIKKDEIYFDIFPNPARSELNIVLPEFAKKLLPIIYYIRDASGNTVLSGELLSISNSININTLRTGVYFITADDYTEKFIKE